MSPRAQAMHVADVSMAFCKPCKLLPLNCHQNLACGAHWVWQDLPKKSWAGNVSFSAIREFAFSWERFIHSGDLLVGGSQKKSSARGIFFWVTYAF